MQKYWKIIIGVLLALAIALGLLQRNSDPYLSGKKTTYNFSNSDKSLADYYYKANELAKQESLSSTAVFLAAGDISLSRSVAEKIKKTNNPNLPFENISKISGLTDFNFANLESPFSSSTKTDIIGGHSLVFGAPSANIKGLADNNFKVLNLASNHALDLGSGSMLFTKNLLLQNGIKSFGVGNNLAEAWQTATINTKGINLCFLGASYSSINDNGKTLNNYVARIEDTSNLKSSILNAQSMCDFIIVSMHAGTEYTRNPNPAQIKFARAAIDAGADMVIGHHPHWVQTIERYCPNNSATISPSPLAGEGGPTFGTKGGTDEGRQTCLNPKYIFYSLGNFIFDQSWSAETSQGLALKIQVTKNQSISPLAPKAASADSLQGQKQNAKLESVELIPVIIENNSTPRKATAQESKKILEKIGVSQSILR